MNKGFGDIPVRQIDEIQKQLHLYHDIVYHQMKGMYAIQTPVKNDFFTLILFEKAEGKHVINGREYTIKDMQLHMVFAGQIHHWEYKSTANIYQIFVHREVFERLEGFMQYPALVYKKKPVTELNIKDFQKLVREFQDIRDELRSPSPVMNEIMYSKMKIIIRNISRQLQKNGEYFDIYESHPVLFDFMSLLAKDFKLERTKKYYAGILGINANYLNVLCKKYFEKTATEIIHSHIVDKIQYRLMMTDEPLKDIAFDFGFQSYGYFSGFIKKYTGFTPKQLRESYLKKGNE
ncbi:helix-turn-helix domain-containing protein [Chryseobacterium sp.]|uniref:helix-turn-helix domain-containing protein n=1 Tax=Chryseobacterium sp. TaxID=1871047 RepID=UPI00333F7CBE